MKKQPRFVWEVAVVLVLVAIAAIALALQQSRWKQRLGEAEQFGQTEVSRLRHQAEKTGSELAASQAEAVARAFASGIYPALLGGRPELVDDSVGQLIQLPDVVFAHVVDESGAVIATSDRKLATVGSVGTRAAWVLEPGPLTSRAGAAEGTVELSLPLPSPANERLRLWLGFDASQLLARVATKVDTDSSGPAHAPGSGQ